MKISITFVLACLAGATALYAVDTKPSFREFVDDDRRKAAEFYNSKSTDKPLPEIHHVDRERSIKCKGAPNLHIVSTNLYRSAQPTEEGMRNLKAKGIKTIVNLREFHSDRDEIGDTDLEYVHIRMNAWHLKEKDVIAFLEIATDTNRAPVLVHCKHGADRTGAMCATYRIVVEGWTKKAALREMQDGGFNFHEIFANIPEFIDSLDIAALRKKLNLKLETVDGD
jgi:protein tyrosine/serine phosphatase